MNSDLKRPSCMWSLVWIVVSWIATAVMVVVGSYCLAKTFFHP